MLFYLLMYLAALPLHFANADLLVRERCFCRKDFFGDNGSFLLARYFDQAANDSAQVGWQCHNNHCVTQGYFLGETKCTRSEADGFTFCFRTEMTSSDEYSIDGSDWVPVDYLDTEERQINNCDQLCRATFDGLPVLDNVWASANRWSWRVPDRLGLRKSRGRGAH